MVSWKNFLVLSLALPVLAQTDYHWVSTWTSMPQLVEPDNLPPAPFVGLGFGVGSEEVC